MQDDGGKCRNAEGIACHKTIWHVTTASPFNLFGIYEYKNYNKVFVYGRQSFVSGASPAGGGGRTHILKLLGWTPHFSHYTYLKLGQWASDRDRTETEKGIRTPQVRTPPPTHTS